MWNSLHIHTHSYRVETVHPTLSPGHWADTICHALIWATELWKITCLSGVYGIRSKRCTNYSDYLSSMLRGGWMSWDEKKQRIRIWGQKNIVIFQGSQRWLHGSSDTGGKDEEIRHTNTGRKLSEGGDNSWHWGTSRFITRDMTGAEEPRRRRWHHRQWWTSQVRSWQALKRYSLSQCMRHEATGRFKTKDDLSCV